MRTSHLPIQKSKSCDVARSLTAAVIVATSMSLSDVRRRYRGNRADSALYLCLTSGVLTPTARLLELLELLQAQPLITGREISDRLEIDPRTVRRYVEALQNLGIPSRASAASAAGIASGRAIGLPPLMLTDDEAVAVALGCRPRDGSGCRAPPRRSRARS